MRQSNRSVGDWSDPKRTESLECSRLRGHTPKVDFFTALKFGLYPVIQCSRGAEAKTVVRTQNVVADVQARRKVMTGPNLD